MQPVELCELRTFTTWCRRGSVRETAARMGNAPATVSRRIARVQRWLGLVPGEFDHLDELAAVTAWVEQRLTAAGEVVVAGRLPQPDLRLGELRVLAAVVRAGSISGAAHQLDLVQPAVTRTVQRLERSLGCALLHRSRYGVSATAEAAVLAVASEDVEARLLEFVTSVRVPAALQRVRVGLAPGQAVPVLKALSVALRGVVVDVVVEAARPALLDLTDDRLDVLHVSAYRPDLTTPAGTRTLDVGQVPLTVMMSDRDPLAARTALAPADLTERVWVVRVGFEWEAEQLWAVLGLRPDRRHVVLDSAEQRQLVTGEGALSFLPATAPLGRGLTRRPLEQDLRITDVIAWRRPQYEPVARLLFDAVCSQFVRRARTAPDVLQRLRASRGELAHLPL